MEVQLRRWILTRDKNKTNHHGTQKKGEPWNQEMVRGFKIRLVNINYCGPTRVRWSKRLLIYFPDGSWWNIDLILLKRETKISPSEAN